MSYWGTTDASSLLSNDNKESELALYLKSAKKSIKSQDHALSSDHAYNQWQKKETKNNKENKFLKTTISTQKATTIESPPSKKETVISNTRQPSHTHSNIQDDISHESWMSTTSTISEEDSENESDQEDDNELHPMLRNVKSIIELDDSILSSASNSPQKSLEKNSETSDTFSIDETEGGGHMTNVFTLNDLEDSINSDQSIHESINSNTEVSSKNSNMSKNSSTEVSPNNSNYKISSKNSNTDVSSINTNTEISSIYSNSESINSNIRGEETMTSLENSDEYYSDDFEEDFDENNESNNGTTAVCGSSLPRQPDHFDVSTQTDDLLRGVSINEEKDMPILLDLKDQPYLHTTPLLPHVVRSEALQALTVYSPAVLALNNLTLSQVALTRQLIEQTKSLSSSILTSPDHHYVTLDETKEYIKRHRPKILTPKEASNLVKKKRKGNTHS